MRTDLLCACWPAPALPFKLTPIPRPATRSYAFPSLIKLMPAPLLVAARATVDSGRAARQWIEKKRQEDDG